MSSDATHPIPHPDLAAYVLGALDPAEAEVYEQHLASCAACREEVGELSVLPGLLDRAAPPVEVPPHLRQRTFDAIEREASARRISAAARRLVAVAAAVLLVAAGLVVGSQAGNDDDVLRVELVAADGGPAPEARGEARARRVEYGWEIDLVVEGLPQPPEGSYFECWYVGQDDRVGAPRRVSAGTFVVDENGRAEVHMTTAARFREFPTMGITLEPASGDPSADGEKVLVAESPPE